jgi:hypothetical protein
VALPLALSSMHLQALPTAGVSLPPGTFPLGEASMYHPSTLTAPHIPPSTSAYFGL